MSWLNRTMDDGNHAILADGTGLEKPLALATLAYRAVSTKTINLLNLLFPVKWWHNGKQKFLNLKSSLSFNLKKNDT